MSENILVIGASGILAPAAAELARGGATVIGVSRTRIAPTGVVSLAANAQHPVQLRVALLAGAALVSHWDAALVYQPAVSPESLAEVSALVHSPIVLLRTSEVMDPAANADSSSPQQDSVVSLILGWHRGTRGETRWHTPEEVSVAALAVLRRLRPAVLGVVRPWESRPRFHNNIEQPQPAVRRKI